MLSILPRELVAAEAHCHPTCNRQFINIGSNSGETLKDDVLGETKDEDKETVSVDYAGAKLNAYSKLFNYIRNELFENKEIIDLSKLNEMLIGFMKDGAVQE